MDINSKILALPAGRPDLSGSKAKLFFFFFIVSGLLFAETFFFISSAPKNNGAELILGENALFQEELAVSNGNTLLPVSDPSGPELKIVKKMPVIVTAYSSTPWETWGNPFITASGIWVKDGIIANNLLPFGTKVRMPEIYGDRVFVVEDRMNSRKGNYHFDIWFPSYWEALNFGAKRTYLEVLEG